MKTKLFQNIEQEIPIKRVKCFWNIYFQSYVSIKRFLVQDINNFRG